MKANKLGLWSIVFLGINGIIGSGVFLLPNKAMDLFGPYSLLILLFDMVLVLCISLCFAEASSLFKDTGGPYIYAKEAFGDFIGYEVGFLVWATRIIAFSTMSVGFATALAGIVPEWNTVFMKNVISCGVVVVLSLMNLLGVKPFKIIQNIATIGKLIPLVLFVGIGVFFIDFDNFVAPPDTVYTTTTFGSCASLLFYAFTGFESICVAAGDMDNPTKNVPKATIDCDRVDHLLPAAGRVHRRDGGVPGREHGAGAGSLHENLRPCGRRAHCCRHSGVDRRHLHHDFLCDAEKRTCAC